MFVLAAIALHVLAAAGLSIPPSDIRYPRICANATMLHLPYKNVTLTREGFQSSDRDLPPDFNFPTSHGIEMTLGNATIACKLNIADARIYARYQMETCTFGNPYNCAQQVLCGGILGPPRTRNGSEGYIAGFGVSSWVDGVSFSINSSIGSGLYFEDLNYITNDEDLHHEIGGSTIKEEPSAFLGLSKESWFLEAVFNRDHISSKAWGFFSSWTGIQAGLGGTIQDGALVLGGYDASKIDRPFTTFPMGSDPNCLLPLKVKELKILGKVVEKPIGPGGVPEEFEACIDPFVRGFTFPESVRDNIKVSLQSYDLMPTAERERRFNVFNTSGNTIYEGGIEVPRADLDEILEQIRFDEFDNGFEIVLDSEMILSVPVHQIFQPARNAGRTRFELLYNSINTTVVPIYSSGSDRGTKVRLGTPFLSTNYLVVNPNNNTFSLAPVKREIDFAPVDLVAILGSQDCNNGDPPDEPDGSDDNQNDPTSTPPPDSSDNQPTSTGGLSRGAIAGIAVGSAVVIFLAIAIYFVYRKYYRPAAPFAPAPPPPDDPSAHMAEKDGDVRHQLEAKTAPQEAGGGEIHHMNDHFPPGQGPQTRPNSAFQEMP